MTPRGGDGAAGKAGNASNKSDAGQAGAGGQNAGAGGQAGAAVDDEDSELCDEFEAPFSRRGTDKRVTMRFVSIDPKLHYKGKYNWTLELHDASGAAIGHSELSAKAWMPAHGHGTTPITVQHEAGSASYQLRVVNLYMAGKWEVTVTSKTSAGEDSVVFRACPIEPPEDDAGTDAGADRPRGHG